MTESSANPRRTYFAHSLLRARDWQDRPEFASLCDWWRGAHRPGGGLCALVGIGGAGKTAMAERLLRILPGVPLVDPKAPKDPSLPPPRAAFVFSFYDAPNADALFGQLAAWLGGRDYDESAPIPSYEQTRRVLERAAAGAASDGRLMLLVLDGLEKVQDDGARGVFGEISDGRLRELTSRVADGYIPGAALLLTTRFPVAHLEDTWPALYRPIDVAQIDLATGVALLHRRGVRGTDDQLARIVEEAGRHALTVDLAGGYIAEFGSGDPDTRLNLVHIHRSR